MHILILITFIFFIIITFIIIIIIIIIVIIIIIILKAMCQTTIFSLCFFVSIRRSVIFSYKLITFNSNSSTDLLMLF